MSAIAHLDRPVAGSYFVATYPPFACWDHDGARAYADALERPSVAPETPLGLYVHLPLCVERCRYCYYLSYDDRPDAAGRTVDGLVAEAARVGRSPAVAGRHPAFAYFGGGTPSLLSRPRLRRLLAGLRAAFPWDTLHEVTFECAPRSTTEEKLRELRDAGVTRISLGVQQLDDAVLRANGRVHLVRDAERAYAAIRRVGFAVVNVDLIAGLVGETERSYRTSLERVVALAPDSVTIYALEMPRNTPLYRSWRAGELGAETPPSWETKWRRVADGFAALEAEGYTVRSGYAAVRDPERHPFLYQDLQYRGADLLSIGASAFSYLGGVHHQNVAALDAWLEAVEADTLPLGRGRLLDADERLVRELVLQLKLGRVDLDALGERHGADVGRRFATTFAELADAGWLSCDAGTVTLTRTGLVRADALVRRFYLPRHRGVRY